MALCQSLKLPFWFKIEVDKFHISLVCLSLYNQSSTSYYEQNIPNLSINNGSVKVKNWLCWTLVSNISGQYLACLLLDKRTLTRSFFTLVCMYKVIGVF